jgi:hypothetical protein
MSVIAALTDAQVTPEAKHTLEAVNAALGVTPNLFRTAANSSAALEGLVSLNGALGKGKLRVRVSRVDRPRGRARKRMRLLPLGAHGTRQGRGIERRGRDPRA